MKANLPSNELNRLLALQSLSILDTPREQNFDDIAQLAMHICEVSIAVVSLVDKDRQWFKSCLGLDASETPRDVAFCAHAILTPDDVLIVEDATKDIRFIDNDLVTGPPHIRFYAGAPLVTQEGYALGTLCVIDTVPRKITSAQIDCLKSLARQVMQLLRMQSLNETVSRHSSRLQMLADRMPLLIGELNAEGCYEFANRKHRDWLNYSDESLQGKTPCDLFPPYLQDKIQNALSKSLTGTAASVELTTLSGRVLDMSFIPRLENGKVQCVYEMALDVTERKIHLQVMQQERVRLQSVIEGTHIGTWEWDVQEDLVNINERWASMLGYRLEELVPVTKQKWIDLLNPLDIPATTQSLENHFNGIAPFHDVQFRMRKKNGQWLWVQAHGKVVERDSQGAPTLVTGMHADIDAQKRAFEKLKEQEDLLRNMLSNFPGAAYRYENDGPKTLKYLSDAVFQLTGYTAEEFLWGEQSFEAIIHPDDLQPVTALRTAALVEQQPFEVEYRIATASGEWRAVQEIGRGVYNLDGELEFVDGFLWDVQAKHDSEIEMRSMMNKLSQLFQMSTIGILRIDSEGRLLEANPEFVKILGYTQDELKLMTFLDITPDEDLEASKRAVEFLKTKGRFGPLEKRYKAKNGELVHVEISGSLISSDDFNQGWWTLVKDIREQKRIDRMKNEFISTVSHELRTPLTSITGSLGLVANNMLGVLPEKIQGMLSIAYKNSQRLTLLINDLLDMEKLLAGKMQFDLKTQSIVPLIDQAIAENKSYADKYDVRFDFENIAQNATIHVDAFRLQQVLNNFLSNAAKYSPAKEAVIVRLENFGEQLKISVIDKGSGIPEEFRSRIFQKFSQADASDSRVKGGTGLGLSISKELVERMGGEIGFESGRLESGEQGGTCFYAIFNLAKV